MIILSLDLSTKSSGWAIFKDGILLDSGCITSSSLDLLKRINIMISGLKTIVEKYQPNKVVAEEVRPENGLQNLKTHSLHLKNHLNPVAKMIFHPCHALRQTVKAAKIFQSNLYLEVLQSMHTPGFYCTIRWKTSKNSPKT